MKISRIKLRNWRNFRDVEIPDLPDIVYLIGPNASGKSNILDALNFLKDIAKPLGGGIQQAVNKRGGMKNIRSFHAQGNHDVKIEIDVSDLQDNLRWTYSLSFNSSEQDISSPLVARESVIGYSAGNPQSLLDAKADSNDGLDTSVFQQTHLEQSFANRAFKDLADYLGRIKYFHLIPQILKFGDQMGGRVLDEDPFGQKFIDRISSTDCETRTSRISKIEASLKSIIPQLEKFTFEKDGHSGKPHLEIELDRHRFNGGKQREDQISDGTLRLIAMLWTCYEFSGYPILIEEPELSLNDGIVEDLHWVFEQSLDQSERGGQLFLTTHNRSLLSNPGIDTRSLVVIESSEDGSQARKALEAELMVIESGFPASEAILNAVEDSTKMALKV